MIEICGAFFLVLVSVVTWFFSCIFFFFFSSFSHVFSSSRWKVSFVVSWSPIGFSSAPRAPPTACVDAVPRESGVKKLKRESERSRRTSLRGAVVLCSLFLVVGLFFPVFLSSVLSPVAYLCCVLDPGVGVQCFFKHQCSEGVRGRGRETHSRPTTGRRGWQTESKEGRLSTLAGCWKWKTEGRPLF